jgi:hypothetical protein
MPQFIKYLDDLKLPDVEFKGGKMTNITFAVLEPENVDNVNFTLVPSNNSVMMIARNMSTQVQGNFTYDFFLMEIDGTAYVNITDMVFDIEVNLTTQTTKFGKLAPAIKLLNLDININPDNIKIKLVGSLVAKIASLFTEIFKNQIIHQIVADSKKEIADIIDKDIN